MMNKKNAGTINIRAKAVPNPRMGAVVEAKVIILKLIKN